MSNNSRNFVFHVQTWLPYSFLHPRLSAISSLRSWENNYQLASYSLHFTTVGELDLGLETLTHVDDAVARSQQRSPWIRALDPE